MKQDQEINEARNTLKNAIRYYIKACYQFDISDDELERYLAQTMVCIAVDLRNRPFTPFER